MQLRPYQTECLDTISLAAMQGCNRQLVVLPTAAGKTVIFAQIPMKLRMRRPDKMLVLVQSDEIAYQSVSKLAVCNPTLKIGLEKAQYKATWADDIVVASIQTLAGSKKNEDGSWEWSKRLLSLDRDAFRYIVIDECHHSISSSYAGPLRYFKVLKSEPQFNDPSRLLLGVTATPNRADNKGLELLFEKIVYSRDIRSMVTDGWLATPEAHRVDTMVNLSGVEVRRGDFVTAQLERVINIPERNNLIVDKYLELGENAPFLAFTCDIQHTIDLTETFRKRGIECFGIASKTGVESEWLITKEKERATAIERFNKGEFRGLLSCAALLEGFDAPRAMVGLDGAPTASRLRFTQKFGRVLRPFPAPEAAATWTGWKKRCAIWIDFVDSSTKHSLTTAPSLFGLRADFNAKGKSLTGVVEEIERIKATKPAVNASLYTNLDALKAFAEKIDLFAVPTVAPEVQQFSQFSWTSGVSEGVYQLSLPGDKAGMLSVRVNALGEFEIAKHVTGIKTPLGSAKTLKEALKMADKNVPAEAMIVLKSDAGWRTLPATRNQIWAYKRLYPEARKQFPSEEAFFLFCEQKFSRGDMSTLISARDQRGR